MTNIANNNGVYAVGEKVFFNKVNAILESKTSHKPVEYKFHDEVYSNYNWTVEPTETLDELYARRAWEIRNSYDYLVLHFSGGSDSANILETFIKNKIPVDELFIRGPLSVIDKNVKNNSAANMYAESFLNALPLAEYVKKYFMPDVRISIKDTSQFSIDYFKNNKEWYSPERVVPGFTPHISWCTQLDILDPHYVKLTEAGKKVGHILGLDKPMVYHDNGQYKVRFLDKRVYIAPLGFLSQTMKIPMYPVAFYWATSTAKIIIKQAHAVKNFIKTNKINPGILNALTGRPWHNFISDIVYKRTLPIYFIPEKSPGGIVQPWDKFFFAEGLTSTHGKIWMDGMGELENLIPDEWKHDGTVFNDIKGVYTKSYSIGA